MAAMVRDMGVPLPSRCRWLRSCTESQRACPSTTPGILPLAARHAGAMSASECSSCSTRAGGSQSHALRPTLVGPRSLVYANGSRLSARRSSGTKLRSINRSSDLRKLRFDRLLRSLDGAAGNEKDVAAHCTMTKGLSESCAPCAKAHCCAPPLAFASSNAQSLGCRMGCRKPLPPGAPKLADSDRAAVIKNCIATCDGLFADPTGEAARLDECLATQCSADCLTSR